MLRLRRRLGLRPSPHFVRFGTLRRLEPISRRFGFDRGLPIGRRYIHVFFERHRNDIQGRILTTGDDLIWRFGHDVERADVISPNAAARVTLVADLQDAPMIPDNSYSCVLLPQTLQFIPDMSAALATVSRILEPGGVLLATFSGISAVSLADQARWGEYWRVTADGARYLAERFFETVEVDTFGNVRTAVGFLHGVASNEIPRRVWEVNDEQYPVIVGLRAVKSPAQRRD